MRASCLLLLAVAIGCAQQVTPTFRTTSDLVLVDAAIVHHTSGTPGPRLQQGDLEIYEDEVRQEVKFFSRDQLPLSVVLLFDLTDTSRLVLKRLASGAKAALVHLKSDDEVAVMTYGASAGVIERFTTNRDRIVEAIERASHMKTGEPAFFNEAIYQATVELNRPNSASSRRVIVWLTDNIPNVPSDASQAEHAKSIPAGGLHTEDQAIRALHESGTTVTALLSRSTLMAPFLALIVASQGHSRDVFPPGDARKYAEVTGGQAIKLGGKRVDQRLADLIDELRSRYTLGYRPSTEKPPGTFCKLRVELAPGAPLRPAEWTVLATTGYYRK
jgi:VWFA-related protein